MTLIKKPVILSLLLMGFSAIVNAQSNEWKVLNNEVISLYQQGQYDKATMVARRAVVAAEKDFGANHPNVATSLNKIVFTNLVISRSSFQEFLHPRNIELSLPKLPHLPS